MTVLCTDEERREWRQAGRGRFTTKMFCLKVTVVAVLTVVTEVIVVTLVTAVTVGTVKGVPAKMRPPETLTNADFKVLYRTNILFLTTSVYFQDNNLEFMQNASFRDVEKE